MEGAGHPDNSRKLLIRSHWCQLGFWREDMVMLFDEKSGPPRISEVKKRSLMVDKTGIMGPVKMTRWSNGPRRMV